MSNDRVVHTEVSMHREPVVSISIAAVGYDPEQRLLEVEYKNGRIVQYPGVPADEQEDRMTGEALNMHLKRLKRPAFPSRDRRDASPKRS